LDWKAEIARRVEAMPPEFQRRVYRYASQLFPTTLVGEPGSDLAANAAGLLDPESAREMKEAIEAECERVAAGEW
jgi:hypothetical protein